MPQVNADLVGDWAHFVAVNAVDCSLVGQQNAAHNLGKSDKLRARMSYQYRVLSRGLSSFMTNLETFADVLQNFLDDDEVRGLTRSGWELWQIQTLSEKQGNCGFLLVLRRGA